MQRKPIIVKRSLVIVISKLVVIQSIVMLAYLVSRFAKFTILGQLYYEDDIRDLEFWIGILAFMFFMIGQALASTFVILQWAREQYEITRESVVHVTGILSNNEEVYSLNTVEVANVTQDFTGRMLNYGTVSFYSPVLKKQYYLYDIPNPEKIKNSIIELIAIKHESKDKIIPLNQTDTIN